MIQHAHVHQRQSAFECRGQRLIGAAGFGHTGRMIVGKNYRCRIVMQRAFDHLTRIYAGLRECAAEKIIHRQHAVLRVQKDADKHFMWTIVQPQPQVIPHRLRRIERHALL